MSRDGATSDRPQSIGRKRDKERDGVHGFTSGINWTSIIINGLLTDTAFNPHLASSSLEEIPHFLFVYLATSL